MFHFVTFHAPFHLRCLAEDEDPAWTAADFQPVEKEPLEELRFDMSPMESFLFVSRDRPGERDVGTTYLHQAILVKDWQGALDIVERAGPRFCDCVGEEVAPRTPWAGAMRRTALLMLARESLPTGRDEEVFKRLVAILIHKVVY